MNAWRKMEQIRDAQAKVKELLSYDALVEEKNTKDAEAFRVLTREERAAIEAVRVRFEKDLARLTSALRAVEDREEAGGKT